MISIWLQFNSAPADQKIKEIHWTTMEGSKIAL